MSANDWSLIFQIPVAACLIVVVVLFLKEQKETRRMNQEMMDKFIKAQTEQVLAFNQTIREQQSIMMAAIKEQREQHLKSLNAITDGFYKLVDTIESKLAEMGKAMVARLKEKKIGHRKTVLKGE